MRGWKRWLCSMLALTCLGLAACASSAETAESPVRVLFINVGKADAALIWVGERTYLMDTGHEDSYPALKQALEAYQVTHLDAIFLSHIHKDHVGGLEWLLTDGMAVERLYAPSIHGKKKLEKHPVYQAAEAFALPVTWLEAGDTVSVDEQARFRVLGPLRLDEENENNNSLVLLLETEQGTVLFAGDMELQEEADLLESGALAPVDVLKVGHHGEDDASSELFIYTVRPKLAVVSTNTVAEPDTPDAKVLLRLRTVRSETFETQTATCGVLVRLFQGTPSAWLVNSEDMQ